MTTGKPEPPLVALAEEVVETVCVGQIAALAALRAEMTALSTMMSGVPHPKGTPTEGEHPGARPVDPDPEDTGFDNMPV